MADDKSAVGGPDRARVASGEDYEIADFARRHGLTPDEVREMVARVGTSREALEQEAGRRKGP
jgi:hypothetical protein